MRGLRGFKKWKHGPIQKECKGCPIIVEDEGVKVCEVYTSPRWIWENKYCPIKTRNKV